MIMHPSEQVKSDFIYLSL